MIDFDSLIKEAKKDPDFVKEFVKEELKKEGIVFVNLEKNFDTFIRGLK